MRVRLHVDEFELTGYRNIKLGHQLNELNLEKLGVDLGELDELIIDTVIDYVPVELIETALTDWSRRIKVGGKLIITGVELYEVSKAITNYNIDIHTANALIYGTSFAYPPKRMAFSLGALSSLIQNKTTLKIIKKRINGYNYAIEGVRQ